MNLVGFNVCMYVIYTPIVFSSVTYTNALIGNGKCFSKSLLRSSIHIFYIYCSLI